MEGTPKPLLPEGYSYHPEGYLWYVLPIEKFSELPETVSLRGNTLFKKSEFHVTVANARGIARDLAGSDELEQQRIETRLQLMLSEHVRAAPIEFDGFEDDLRLATSEVRMSIAARCRMKNVEGYFERIAAEYGKEYSLQPAHVSLYTKTGMAVGIDSKEEIESFEKVALPDVQRILDTIS